MQVDSYLADYMRAKQLAEMTGIASIAEKAYQELELLDFTDELLQLEHFFIRLKNKKQSKPKWNNLIK